MRERGAWNAQRKLLHQKVVSIAMPWVCWKSSADGADPAGDCECVSPLVGISLMILDGDRVPELAIEIRHPHRTERDSREIDTAGYAFPQSTFVVHVP